jgi:uncharacterized membrane protein YidH (DUF202 family)
MPEHEPEAAPSDDLENTDPRLAQERTDLAWVRTAIGFAALGGAILKVSPVLGFPVLAMSALVWMIGRVARRDGGPGAGGGERRGLLLMITIAVTVVSIVALVVALVGVKSPLSSR